MMLRLCGVGVFVFGAVPVPTIAQRPVEVRLTAAAARYAEPFSSIRGFLALPDGRVLVADGIDETLLRIDLRSGKTDTIGRKGAGPGEYVSPDALFTVENGNVLLADLGNGRLSLFDPSGKYRESIPIARGQPGQGMTLLMPRGTDREGRIYFQPGPQPGAGSDSGAVIRFDRTRETMDTLARVGLPEMKTSSSGGAGNRSVMMRPVPLSPADAWAAAPDGRVAVARAAGYRVEWVHPDGRVVRGTANPFRPVRIREPDKREWLEELANGLSVMVNVENGRMNVRLGRGAARQSEPDPSQYEWPTNKPAFTRVLISTEGDAWVERSVPAGEARAYDVFGADARLKRTITLQVQRRVLGFGPGVVYVQHTDPDDGLHYLERYRIP